MRERLCRSRGSLLIEALLAVVILSVSMTIVIRSMSQSARATAYSAEYFRSLFFLENKMAEIFSSPEEYASTSKSGQLPYPYDHYAYSVSTEPLGLAHVDNLRKLTLDLSWDRGAKSNNLKLTTFLAQPETE